MLYLDKERKDLAKIERRRQLEEERKKRFFDPKVRLIGVDVKAWEKQIEEKNAFKTEEELRTKEYYDQKKREDQICMAKDKKWKMEEREVIQKVKEFRENLQRFEDRREFDLNDPLYKKKQLPVRLFDDDPRCTISSAQKFEGEDLSRCERLQVQREQTKSWLAQQIHEKALDHWEKLKAEESYQEALLQRDRRAVELDRMEKECFRKLQQANAEFNKSLGEERAFLAKQKWERDDMDKNSEKYNWMTGDFLTENPEQAASNLGHHRLLADRYKGEPKSKAFETLTEQQRQIMEKEARKRDKDALEKAWEQLRDDLRRRVYFQDKDIVQKQRELNAKMFEMNKKLAQEKQERDEYLNKTVYVNVPNEKFFDQFNRSTNF